MAEAPLRCTDPCCSIKGPHDLTDACDQMRDEFCAECGDKLPPGHDPADLCPICTIVEDEIQRQILATSNADAIAERWNKPKR